MSYVKYISGSLDLPNNTSDQIEEKLSTGISNSFKNKISNLGLSLNWNIHPRGYIYYVKSDKPVDFSQDIKVLMYLLLDICTTFENPEGRDSVGKADFGILNGITGDFMIHFKTEGIDWHYDILMIKDGKVIHHRFEFPEHTKVHKEYNIGDYEVVYLD